MHRHLQLFLALLLPGMAAAADTTIVMSAEVRVRGEVDGRDFNARTPMVSFSLLRSRLGAEFRPSRGMRGFIQVQDSRLFGGELPSTTDNTTSPSPTLALHQSFVELDGFIFDPLSIRAGRMELSYGKERLVGSNDWENGGRAFDGVLFRYASAGHRVELFSANVVETVVPPSPIGPLTVSQPVDHGFLFSGLWYEWTELPGVRLVGYFFHEWLKKDDLVSRGTVGGLGEGTSGCLLFDGEFAYQGGEVGYTGVSAFMGAASAGVAFDEHHDASLVAGYQYVSGTGPGELTDHTFGQVFHSGHDLYGAMDFFAVPSTGTNGRGLQDLFLSFRASFSAEISLAVTFHEFLLAKPWSGDRNLGQELDVCARYSTWESAALEAGISAFNPGKVMKAWYNGSDPAVWGYLATRVWI